MWSGTRSLPPPPPTPLISCIVLGSSLLRRMACRRAKSSLSLRYVSPASSFRCFLAVSTVLSPWNGRRRTFWMRRLSFSSIIWPGSMLIRLCGRATGQQYYFISLEWTATQLQDSLNLLRTRQGGESGLGDGATRVMAQLWRAPEYIRPRSSATRRLASYLRLHSSVALHHPPPLLIPPQCLPSSKK